MGDYFHHFFYEGDDDDVPAFLAKMAELGLRDNVSITVAVPAEKLAAFERLDLPVGT